MAVVLIRMKLAVLSHSLHGRRALFFTVSAVLGAAAGLVSLLLPLAAGADLEAGTDVVATVGAVWALGWLVGPLLSGGGDETLRPENFALLPIRARPLAAGLLAASAVGVGPAATLLALGSVVMLGVSFGGLPAVVAVIGLALELAFVVAASQVVLAGLGAVIASRRGRDIGVVLASLAGLAFLPLQWLFNAVGPVVLERRSPVLSTVLRAVPSGWSAVAVRAAARGELLWTVAPLVGLAVLVAALLGVWAPLLRRRMTVSSTAGAAARSRRTGSARRDRPVGPVGAVVVRELRLWWRDPRRRSLLLSSVLIGVALPLFSLAGSGRSTVAFAALFVVTFAVMQLGNLYGLDGDAVWHLLVTPGAARADVRGRQLAWLVIAAPVTVLAAVVGPLLVGSPGAYPWLAGLVPVLLGSGAGLLVMQSAYLPYPVASQRNGNPFASGGAGSGAGCSRSMAAVAYLLLLVPAVLPVLAVIVAARFSGIDSLAWLGAPVGVALGVWLAWWWGAIAYRRLLARGPELLVAVAPSS